MFVSDHLTTWSSSMASHNSVIHGFILNLLADNSETATDDTDPAVYSETIVECSWDQDEKVWVRESGWINQRQMISTLRERSAHSFYMLARFLWICIPIVKVDRFKVLADAPVINL